MIHQEATDSQTTEAAPLPTANGLAVEASHELYAGPTPSKTEKPTNPQSHPPVWARYINSRLKQFCTR
jgi:hypothetical protein